MRYTVRLLEIINSFCFKKGEMKMKNPNTCRVVMFFAILMGIALAGTSAIMTGVEPVSLTFIFGVGLIVIGLGFGIITVRCPFCQHSLNKHLLGFNEYCPHCGAEIE